MQASVTNALLGRITAHLVWPTRNGRGRKNERIVLSHLIFYELSRDLVVSPRTLFINRRISAIPNAIQSRLKFRCPPDSALDSGND